jgi:hypothetical protein
MYAYIHEHEVGDDRSTTDYDAMGAHMRLEEDPIDGLIVHAAGFCGGKFRMIEIWESPEHQQRFQRERLMPAVQAVAGEDGTPPTTESYDLHNLIVSP